ncbi:YjbF family lipoprotein [Parasulfitobacter algicola]|uniref:YjbF family lipoprotein n=1 Tax=Parasulfitobacter algicola TaxID=2614809 RepID=A0ABX2IK60_9RHOB|nr:YjbF family lipoprotein [Sulfitobacter algicola]NSX53238.1 YjbF family lipoprotein [Sulfitobacter algicola]
MIFRIKPIVWLLCFPMLASCSSGSGLETSALQGLTTTLADVFRGNKDRQAANANFNPATSITRAQVASLPARTWVAHLDERNAWASLTLLGNNRGVRTYLTEDSISVSLRQGVLVATRGLGNDVHVANPNPTLAALSSQGTRGRYTREMTFLDPTSQKISTLFSCTMTPIGPTAVTIAQTRQATRQYSEDCQSDTRKITNLFWTSTSGAMTRTRQWVSPTVGYLDTYLVKP